MSHMDDRGNIEYSDRMKIVGTADAFTAVLQDTLSREGLKHMSFRDAVEAAKRTQLYLETMGYKLPSGKPVTIQVDLPK
jgi:hypothetical protein